MKILVVEDEPKVGTALSEGLRANGDEVTLAQQEKTDSSWQAHTRLTSSSWT
jgi:DNA-binding response OmpR family regulator